MIGKNNLPEGLTLGQIEQAVQMVAQQMGSVAKMLAPNADRKGLLAIVQLAALRICVGAFVETGLPEDESVAVFRDAYRATREEHDKRAKASAGVPVPRPPAPAAPTPPTSGAAVSIFGTRKPSGNN